MQIKTGIFGGSFNPIHIGHLALANYVCEFCGLDELWFLVSPQNPLKAGQDLLPDELRLSWVEKAIEEYPKFKACDIEFRLSKPSYTIHTLDTLKQAYPNRDFYLLVGGDNWKMIDRWYEYKRLIRENHLLVYPRPESAIDTDTLPANVQIVQAPQMEISSTFIRQSLRAGKDIRFFLPAVLWQEAMDIFNQNTFSAM